MKTKDRLSIGQHETEMSLKTKELYVISGKVIENKAS
jgi:hypothetical protein